MRIIGIDPGNTGGVALLIDGKLVDAREMPTHRITPKQRIVNGAELAQIFDEWAQIFHEWPPATFVIERVHSMPKQGVSTTFTFGAAFGVAIGCVGQSELHFIEPTKWKRTAGIPAGSVKEFSRFRATEVFGDECWPLKKHNGLAEAALIAWAHHLLNRS